MRIRLATLAGALAALAAVSVAATPINTGNDLAAVCEPYSLSDEPAATKEATPNKCQQFLSNFLTAYIEAEKIKLDAAARGLPGGQRSPCVRLPDRLTFRDLAKRVVAMARHDTDLLNGSAAMVVMRTLEHDFPCPEDPKAPG